MSAAGSDVFDKTVQEVNTWLKEIMELKGWENRNKAYLALRTVLHVLRRRLPMEEAVHFAAELPLILRGLFFEGWSPEYVPVKMTRKSFWLRSQRLLPMIRRLLRKMEDVVQTVFKVLDQRISQGEISDLKAKFAFHLSI